MDDWTSMAREVSALRTVVYVKFTSRTFRLGSQGLGDHIVSSLLVEVVPFTYAGAVQ
jgi:hypothetical protein